jgi:4'-phosphopantetheinyl transferase
MGRYSPPAGQTLIGKREPLGNLTFAQKYIGIARQPPYTVPRRRTRMDKNTLQLWCAYPEDTAMQGAARASMDLLSAVELNRLHALRFDEHRREYLATRALVRTALSTCYPVAPSAWRFRANAYGKPATDPACGIEFNISNCLGLVVCLVRQGGNVGVDAEPLDRADQILELAPNVFSEQELAQLDRMGHGDRRMHALSLWVLKEAYIKARGIGLSLPLRNFSFFYGGQAGIQLQLDASLEDESGRWHFCLLDHAGHRIALVVERMASPELQLWELRPPGGMPRQLRSRPVRWYPTF